MLVWMPRVRCDSAAGVLGAEAVLGAFWAAVIVAGSGAALMLGARAKTCAYRVLGTTAGAGAGPAGSTKGPTGTCPCLICMQKDPQASKLTCATCAHMIINCAMMAMPVLGLRAICLGDPHFCSHGQPNTSHTWAWRSGVKFALLLLPRLRAGRVAEELLLAPEPAIMCSLGRDAVVSASWPPTSRVCSAGLRAACCFRLSAGA